MIMPERESSKAPTIDPSADPLDPGFQDALVAGEARLSPEQALDAWHRMPIADLGRLADRRCRAIHGDSIRTYVIDRNINYTNVCTAKCTFCAFRRDQDAQDAYTLEYTHYSMHACMHFLATGPHRRRHTTRISGSSN